MKGRIGALLLAAVMAVGSAACIPGTKTTPQDQTCVSYGGGPFEGKNYQETYEPGKGRFVNGLFDKLYCYPVTERSFRMTEGGDAGVLTAPSLDNIMLTYDLAIYFQLNADKVAEFHQAIGIKTAAYTGEGWARMLHEYFLPQIEHALQSLSRTYDAQTAFSDGEAFADIQNELKLRLPGSINNALGDDYFDDFRTVLKRIDVPESLRAELLANKESAVRVQTKKNEVRQAREEAKAIQARQAALEGCDSCILNEAIRSGTIDFWVIPSGQDLTLQTPARERE